MLNDREIIILKYKEYKGIYLLYNKVNNKYYIGSGKNLSRRLSNYYFLSKLNDNRYISNSINHYGHNNFSVFILEVYPSNSDINILEREQYYINKFKPKLNILDIPGNSLGFKHKEITKKKN
jgi:group I intron endonuclease